MVYSRDKTHLKDIVIEKHINILLHCANLVDNTLCIVITTVNTDSKSPLRYLGTYLINLIDFRNYKKIKKYFFLIMYVKNVLILQYFLNNYYIMILSYSYRRRPKMLVQYSL